MSFHSRKLIFGSPTSSSFSDPYFDQTSLLLHGDGIGATPNGQQNNTFLDSSSNNFTITRSGTPSQGSFSPFALNGSAYNPSVHGGSGYFSSGSDALTIPASSNFYPTDTTWTIESYVYLTNPSKIKNTLLYVGTGQSLGISLNRTGIGDTYIYIGTGGSNPWGSGIISSSNLSFNVWNHVALVRNGSTITLYHNGTNVGSVANVPSGFAGTSSISQISSEYFNGYISSFRITKGLAVYTSNFTPPTSPLTLTSNGGATPSTEPTSGQVSLLCNFTNGGIFDNTKKNVLTTVGDAKVSTSVVKYGTGSMYFDGTGDYLDIPRSSNFDFGSGNLTIEGWINVPDINSMLKCIFAVGVPVQVYSQSGTIVVWFNNTDSTVGYIVIALTGPSNSVVANTWTHFAVVRNGSTFTVYVNGVAGTPATGVTQSVFYSATQPRVGYVVGTGTYVFNGYIDDLRITKGVARYTSAFTPPARAFPDR